MSTLNAPRYYTGIGSRETPTDVCQTMTQLADTLCQNGFILRSGHADGADQAFEEGSTSSMKEIYLPWAGFNHSTRYAQGHYPLEDFNEHLRSLAMLTAEIAHPNWDACKDGAKKLHMRNVFQVLGQDLETPSEFVICWTPEGKRSGGTGQALRIAEARDIPIFDLGDPNGMDKLVEFGKYL